MLLCNHQILVLFQGLNNKNISVSNAKYAKHSTKAYEYLVSIHTTVSF